MSSIKKSKDCDITPYGELLRDATTCDIFFKYRKNPELMWDVMNDEERSLYNGRYAEFESCYRKKTGILFVVGVVGGIGMAVLLIWLGGNITFF